MHRLLALPLVAAAFAASAFAAPAHAAVECYGVQGGNVIVAGVCAGSSCMDECYIVVDPYCQSGVVSKQDAALQPCHLIDGIG
jgi:hypothetical protein